MSTSYVQAIGKGKFSVVYRGERLVDSLPVAIKKIVIGDMMDEKQREKCLKEVRLLQSLNHPQIIAVSDTSIPVYIYKFDIRL